MPHAGPAASPGADDEHHRPARPLAVIAGVAVAGAGAAWVLASRTEVGPIEAWVFRRANSMPTVTWWATWPVMQLGNVVGPLVVATAAAFAWRRWRPPVAVVASAYGAWALAQVVKALAQRDRPILLLDDVVLRESARGLGFVSGHAAITAGMATALWPYLDSRGRAVAVGLTAWVGFGRVLGGAHLPLDVLGGIGLGVLAGVAVHGVVGVPRP